MSPIDSSAITLTSAKDLSSAPIQLNIMCNCFYGLHSSISAIFRHSKIVYLEVLVVVPLDFLLSASSSLAANCNIINKIINFCHPSSQFV